MTAARHRIRRLVVDDWPSVRRIYEEGIASGHATFETEPPEWEEWNASRLVPCRLVAEEDGVVLGFVALSPVSSRSVYRGVAEVMVYVAAAARGRGLGTALLQALVEASEAEGIWTLSAGIFPENTASIRAHERVGFRRVGHRERIGRSHDGRWRDYVLLERRSDVVGMD
ncbi:MAG: GNAT family N-acetyltransferase [Gemmatimonadetes bacterium]|nr:GNAT family N-acetyltransferase [Gemmatimonadota bacterium]